MKLKKIISTTLATVAAFATLGFSACNDNTLVVYTEAGFAPFEYIENGEIVGVDVDKTIANVGVLASQGMQETDQTILRIMQNMC